MEPKINLEAESGRANNNAYPFGTKSGQATAAMPNRLRRQCIVRKMWIAVLSYTLDWDSLNLAILLTETLTVYIEVPGPYSWIPATQDIATLLFASTPSAHRRFFRWSDHLSIQTCHEKTACLPRDFKGVVSPSEDQKGGKWPQVTSRGDEEADSSGSVI